MMKKPATKMPASQAKKAADFFAHKKRICNNFDHFSTSCSASSMPSVFSQGNNQVQYFLRSQTPKGIPENRPKQTCGHGLLKMQKPAAKSLRSQPINLDDQEPILPVSRVQFGRRRFTMFKEDELLWTKNKDLSSIKRRKFSQPTDYDSDTDLVEKEQKKVLADLASSIHQFVRDEDPLSSISNLKSPWGSIHIATPNLDFDEDYRKFRLVSPVQH